MANLPRCRLECAFSAESQPNDANEVTARISNAKPSGAVLHADKCVSPRSVLGEARRFQKLYADGRTDTQRGKPRTTSANGCSLHAYNCILPCLPREAGKSPEWITFAWTSTTTGTRTQRRGKMYSNGLGRKVVTGLATSHAPKTCSRLASVTTKVVFFYAKEKRERRGKFRRVCYI